MVGTIYPAVIQRFVVQPNEYAREQTYIKRNIDATRTAFGLDKIEVKPFDYNTDLTPSDRRASRRTSRRSTTRASGTRTRSSQVLAATEEFQPFYPFSDVDVDRYDVGTAEAHQTLSGVRELDPTQLPSNTWTNRHLVYTHGYGIDTAQANAHNGDSARLPALRHPAASGALPLKQPDVYFGEGLSGYSVVDSKVAEQEANGESERHDHAVQRRRRREGRRASRAGSRSRCASATSTSCTRASSRRQSRILYLRDIQERVQTAAPFLQWDADPYAVVLNGRIVWVLDGYTTTNQYPYSQSINPTVPPGSGLDTQHQLRPQLGEGHRRRVRRDDPLLRGRPQGPDHPHVPRRRSPTSSQTSRHARGPAATHWRYPEDIFDTQTEQYTLYHMTNPQQFFQKAALWDVAPSPDAAGTGRAAATAVAVGGNNGGRNSTLASSGNPIDPLYLMMQLPGETGQEFVLERPFVPRQQSRTSSRRSWSRATTARTTGS